MSKIENYNIHCLKFISIVAVIFYHYFFNKSQYFINGFMGVDIFFIVSGFLISKSLFKNKFDIKIFFIRRFLRIFPSLILMIIFFSTFFSIYLFWEDFQKILESNYFNLTGLSNYYYYFKKIEYGSMDSTSIPFLHTWSLSVEIQFYIFIGIFFYFNYLRKVELILILIIILYLVSFLADNENKKFFFTLYRLYEFFVGVFLAFLQKYKIKNLANISFILLIVILFYSESFKFSKEILIICTCLIIISSNDLYFIKIKYIRSVIKYVSDISYSLYLFHNPLIFSLIYVKANFELLSFYNFLVFILLTVFVSVINYHFIEKLFWKKDK